MWITPGRRTARTICKPGYRCKKVVAKERKKDIEISRFSRFRHRTRYFTDSGIIGSKELVAENYRRFRRLFHSKHEKKTNPLSGPEYRSLKAIMVGLQALQYRFRQAIAISMGHFQ
jgi:hypothetical protein